MAIRRYLPNGGRTELERFIAKPCTANIQTTPSPGSGPDLRSGSIREFLVRFCGLRSVTRSAFFSRTTPHAHTACTRMACSTEKIRREHRTKMALPEPTKRTMLFLLARHTYTPGRFLSALDPDQMIPVRSSGFTTPTPMS